MDQIITMSRTVEVSVIMSAYNSARYLKAAMDSILSQTFTNFEFIIINDGSSDSTENVIRAYADNRIVYIKNPKNLGLIASLNKGLERASGKYIARMDADDVALSDRLKDQLAVFAQHPDAVVTGSDYYLLSEDKLILQKNMNDSDYQKTILLFSTCFAHPTVMMRNIFKETGLRYDERFPHTEDYRLWTELSFRGTFYNVDKPLLKYRDHAGQISVTRREEQYETSAGIRKDYLQRLGFSFSPEEFETHCLIGNNTKILSMRLLLDVESWLNSLVHQNNELQKFGQASFNKAIYKYWLDSCGNTSLGLKAFRQFTRSDLSALCKITLTERVKLLAKCIVRRFSKN